MEAFLYEASNSMLWRRKLQSVRIHKPACRLPGNDGADQGEDARDNEGCLDGRITAVKIILATVQADQGCQIKPELLHRRSGI